MTRRPASPRAAISALAGLVMVAIMACSGNYPDNRTQHAAAASAYDVHASVGQVESGSTAYIYMEFVTDRGGRAEFGAGETISCDGQSMNWTTEPFTGLLPGVFFGYSKVVRAKQPGQSYHLTYTPNSGLAPASIDVAVPSEVPAISAPQAHGAISISQLFDIRYTPASVSEPNVGVTLLDGREVPHLLGHGGQFGTYRIGAGGVKQAVAQASATSQATAAPTSTESEFATGPGYIQLTLEYVTQPATAFHTAATYFYFETDLPVMWTE